MVSLRAVWGNGDAESTLEVSSSVWLAIKAGKKHASMSVSYYEGQETQVKWWFQDRMLSIHDQDGTCRVDGSHISEVYIDQS